MLTVVRKSPNCYRSLMKNNPNHNHIRRLSSLEMWLLMTSVLRPVQRYLTSHLILQILVVMVKRIVVARKARKISLNRHKLLKMLRKRRKTRNKRGRIVIAVKPRTPARKVIRFHRINQKMQATHALHNRERSKHLRAKTSKVLVVKSNNRNLNSTIEGKSRITQRM